MAARATLFGLFFFFFNDTATTEIYTLSLHDALPISNRLKPSGHTCVSPWTTMYISPTGCVYPCLNYYVGNIREQPLRELWNSDRYRQYRKKLLRDGQFPDCIGCCDLFEKRQDSSPLFRLNHNRRPA